MPSDSSDIYGETSRKWKMLGDVFERWNTLAQTGGAAIEKHKLRSLGEIKKANEERDRYRDHMRDTAKALRQQRAYQNQQTDGRRREELQKREHFNSELASKTSEEKIKMDARAREEERAHREAMDERAAEIRHITAKYEVDLENMLSRERGPPPPPANSRI